VRNNPLNRSLGSCKNVCFVENKRKSRQERFQAETDSVLNPSHSWNKTLQILYRILGERGNARRQSAHLPLQYVANFAISPGKRRRKSDRARSDARHDDLRHRHHADGQRRSERRLDTGPKRALALGRQIGAQILKTCASISIISRGEHHETTLFSPDLDGISCFSI